MTKINFVYRNYSVIIEKLEKCKFYTFEIVNNVQMEDGELKTFKGSYHSDKEIRIETKIIDERLAEIYYIFDKISQMIKYNEEVKDGKNSSARCY